MIKKYEKILLEKLEKEDKLKKFISELSPDEKILLCCDYSLGGYYDRIFGFTAIKFKNINDILKQSGEFKAPDFKKINIKNGINHEFLNFCVDKKISFLICLDKTISRLFSNEDLENEIKKYEISKEINTKINYYLKKDTENIGKERKKILENRELRDEKIKKIENTEKYKQEIFNEKDMKKRYNMLETKIILNEIPVLPRVLMLNKIFFLFTVFKVIQKIFGQKLHILSDEDEMFKQFDKIMNILLMSIDVNYESKLKELGFLKEDGEIDKDKADLLTKIPDYYAGALLKYDFSGIFPKNVHSKHLTLQDKLLFHLKKNNIIYRIHEKVSEYECGIVEFHMKSENFKKSIIHEIFQELERKDINKNIEIIECVKFLRLIYEDDMESEVKSAKGLLIEKSVERFINAVNINEVGLFEIKLSNDLKKIFFYVDGKIFQSDNI